MKLASVDFEIAVPGIDEPRDASVDELALAKFNHLVSHHPARTILTADTMVILGARQLGKPKDREHAHAMLLACSGRAISIASSVCVGSQASVMQRHVTSTVQLRRVTKRHIDAYLETGEADDKAGGLALQGKAGAFVDRSSALLAAGCQQGGCFSNVMGLPMCAVAEMLDLPADPTWCVWPDNGHGGRSG